jgi:hypothetical protein
MKETRIKIVVERQPEDVWLATSNDLPGFTVEIEDGVEIYDAACKLALEFIRLDTPAQPDEKIIFDFETCD